MGDPLFHCELPELQVLKLWHNNFTGAIPAKLGENGRLIELDLSSNKLTGLVPKSLCLGRKLQILILRINFLFGLCLMILAIVTLSGGVRLGQNYLTGSIPSGFLYLPELSLMELQNNYLSGQVPQQTSKTPSKLEQMNLADNRLSGPLPASIGNFSNLQILMLSGNRFTGDIPSQIGNPQLCGSYLNPCNYSSTSPLQFHDQNSSRSQVPGKFKLLFALGLLACSLVFAVLAIIKTRKIRRNSNSWTHSIPEAGIRMREILECVKENNIIGRGGAGIVYRGLMPNGEQ
ncbi:leucine-rich repeat receptor serine/threonine-protein kinase [Salix suchowensis]|nr:leucine-rich repeat receptor serine/threonine-protein kinase [Salix suchowensis]